MLTKHEELILLSICKLGDDAYGVTIKKNIKELTGKHINYGSLANTLHSLVKKGMILSRESTPVTQQGGRRKVIYSLTLDGLRSLKHSYDVHKQAWEGIPERFFEGL